MTKIIGLTGGIGSGKTTIANYFRSYGVAVYIADDAAREIMKTPEIQAKLIKTFGNSIVEQGSLSRTKLANLVFNNPEKLRELNAIIHPEVSKDFNRWILNYQNDPYVVYEAAILFESGSYKKCDVIINISAPIELRIERVIKRDKIDKENVVRRINAQWNDAQRIAKADLNIENISLEKTKVEFEKILKILNN